MSLLPVKDQMEIISRGVEEIIPEKELVSKLEENRSLTVKLGCDPSRPDLHVGHGVVLRKLRHFQDLGHHAVLVIGDFTAIIGDPSGQNKTRPQLTLEEAKSNAESYVEQAKVILDIAKLKIVYNSEWLNAMNFSDVIALASKYTVARMMERDDFTKRFESEAPISIHEFLYPLAQGMDSVHLEADVELGGTDQKFNLLVGRDLQERHGQKAQAIITTPLLEGTDGVEKMSKSYGNHIALTDSPEDMYGKTMSIPDDMIEKYFVLAADADESKMESVRQQLADDSNNPRDIKRDLAKHIVALYYSAKDAAAAEEHFDKVVANKDIPDDMEEYSLSAEESVVDIIHSAGLVKSKGEGRRLIKQNAVKIDDKVCTDIQHTLKPGTSAVIKVGKRRFVRVTG